MADFKVFNLALPSAAGPLGHHPDKYCYPKPGPAKDYGIWNQGCRVKGSLTGRPHSVIDILPMIIIAIPNPGQQKIKARFFSV